MIINDSCFIYFKVREESDLEDSQNVFHPDMTHQVFGDQ